MPDLPVMLRVTGRRCVVVGGGPVALRRAASLVEAGATVTVIAPHVSEDITRLPVTVLSRPYQSGDLADAFLVVIATDDSAVNRVVTADARTARVLVNRADDPRAGDLTVPAHAHHGPITLAVHTSGISAAAAAAIRRPLSAALDPDWPRLLELVAPYRGRIQEAFADDSQRQQRLTSLTGAKAFEQLKSGGPDALKRYCEELVAAPGSPGSPRTSGTSGASGTEPS